MHRQPFALLRTALLGATILAGSAGAALADIDDGAIEATGQVPVASGQMIQPTAAAGAVFQTLDPKLADAPNFRANGAVRTVVNPNGTELAVMVSGYNNLNFSQGTRLGNIESQDSFEYVFLYDITGTHAGAPVVKQVLRIPDTYVGLAYAPDGLTLYASGGSTDSIYTYTKQPLAQASWKPGRVIALGHATGVGFRQGATAAGLAVSADGSVLAIANIYNDSVSVIDTATGAVRFDYDLRPFNTDGAAGIGKAGGETPFTVAIQGNATIYVSSIRDREVVVLDISGASPALVKRIRLDGSPNSMILDNATTQDRLFVAQDNSDQVAVIDTARNEVVATIDAIAPPGLLAKTERYTGAATNNLAISPDGAYLYATNGGANALAVIALTGSTANQVVALIPTGWYPNAVSVGIDGRTLYVVNGKSAPGPNPANLTGYTSLLTGTTYPGGNAAAGQAASGANQYVFQLEQAGLLTLPTPKPTDWRHLTNVVAANNRYEIASNPRDEQVMAALRAKIKHVIYVIKENRTFDQVLGDLTNGANADPTLAVFGKTVTPNFHAFAHDFVTLDNFFDSGEVSGNGWVWSTAGRETDMTTKTIALNYSSQPSPGNPGRHAPYESEGQNRDVDVGYATVPQRSIAEPIYPLIAAGIPGGAANLLPGLNNDGAPDGPNGLKQSGYLWDSALRAGLSVRSYGVYLDLGRYFGAPPAIPELQNPYAAGVRVAFCSNPTLRPVTDPYFRGFDAAFPDLYRYQEWQREFDGYVTGGNLPSLSIVRMMHDHMGSFGTAIAGFNTPEKQQADNDYAVGLIAQRVANSPYAGSTLIFVIEDDAQDGPDHVDAHRSTAYVVGPYVRQHAVVKQRYTTVNMVRTIEDVLGMDHLNLNDAYQGPMTDVFDLNQSTWSFHATPSAYLNGTTAELSLPGVQFADEGRFTSTHDAAWWEAQTDGFDWTSEDRVPADLFNRVTWEGMKGTPYPTVRSGLDLGRTTTSDAK